MNYHMDYSTFNKLPHNVQYSSKYIYITVQYDIH